MFAPAAPFPTTAARVELASRLGAHLGKALRGTGVGRVYARAGDFAAALKKSEVTVALVDPAYLASTSGYSVIATSVRGGSLDQGWQLVAKGNLKLADLRGKRIQVPSNGGRETAFVLEVLLGGNVARDYFAKIEVAPDTASALAALGLGKTDVVAVPAGIELSGGAQTVLALPGLAGPVLVTYGNTTVQQRTQLAMAATTFKGDATIGGFRAGDGEVVRAIARRYGSTQKRGPLTVPAVRFVVGDLIEGRKIAIERTPAIDLVR
ncbi:MAG: hypothetical protein WKG01_17920 [Kofleriaceae bacterium]